MSSTGIKRPGVVTFIGVILYIQAALAAVASVMLFAYKARIQDAISTQSGNTLSDGSIVATAGMEAIAAVLLLVVAAGLMRGSRGWRTFVAIVVGIRMALALWVMLFHQTGAFTDLGVVTLLVGAFVLWALYGHDKSEEYFERLG
jgi:hypothetical protein